MDNINFSIEGKDNFPLSIETMELLQSMINQSALTALLGGSTYILSGCEQGDTYVSAGIVVINGEILPFRAGLLKDRVDIFEETENLTAFDENYPNAYKRRYAGFKTGGAYIWNNFARVMTNQQLKSQIDFKAQQLQTQINTLVTYDPPGLVKMWSGLIEKIPSGYRLCDGRLLSRTQYSKLFENIGTAFGNTTPSDFRLPDLRGRFIVGYDDSGANPEYNNISEDSGVVGGLRAGDWANAKLIPVGGNQSHENRPPYFVLAYIIKVK